MIAFWLSNLRYLVHCPENREIVDQSERIRANGIFDIAR